MINPLSLFKPYFDLTLGSKKSHITRVLERPGLWMSPQQLENLIEDLRSVVRTLNIGDLDYGIVKGSKQALDNAVITLIYDGPSGKPFAFNALTIMNCTVRGHAQQVVHLGLVAVAPSARAKGLSWILYGLTTFLLFIKNRFKPVWISNVTQVPAIIGMVSESFGNVYPNPLQNTRRSYDHLVLAREIMTRYRYVFGVGEEAEFDEEAFVLKNAYTGGSDNLKKTFEQTPKHRNAVYNDFTQAALNYDRGDDILQLGQMDVTAYYHYMIHSIPKGSFLILIYKVIFSCIEFSLVPVIQWFSTSKQMGSLRPRK